MKLPKLTSFFLIFFLASFLAQARRLQENYEDDDLKASSSGYPLLQPPSSISSATRSDILLRLRLELPTSQSFLERFNAAIVTYVMSLSSSLSSKEFGKGAAASPPPSPKPSDPQNPNVIAGEFGRKGKSPPPAPKPLNPDHPTIIITSTYGRPATSPPPAPKPLNPDHPTIIINSSENLSFVASA